jgi:hypothetical protein
MGAQPVYDTCCGLEIWSFRTAETVARRNQIHAPQVRAGQAYRPPHTVHPPDPSAARPAKARRR